MTHDEVTAAMKAEDVPTLAELISDLSDTGPDTPVDPQQPGYALALLVEHASSDGNEGYFLSLGERVFAALPRDATDTTTEVARVADALTDHPDWYIKGESTTERMVYGCQGCTVEVWTDESRSDGGDLTQPRAAFAKHQADLLAEAGLLREFPGRVDGAGSGETSNNSECSCAGQVGVPVEHPQSVTETGPGATQEDSAGRGASGGLGERLRSAADYQDRPGAYDELRAMADEADRLENEAEMQRHSARSWRVQAEQARAQVDAIRAAIEREAAHGEAITRCNLVAERFQTVLDGVTAP